MRIWKTFTVIGDVMRIMLGLFALGMINVVLWHMCESWVTLIVCNLILFFIAIPRPEENKEQDVMRERVKKLLKNRK